MLRVYVANFMFCLISQCLTPSLLCSPMATPWTLALLCSVFLDHTLGQETLEH